MFKKCTVLFVSCLCWFTLPAKAELTVKMPLTPLQETLSTSRSDQCSGLAELRSTPVAEALSEFYEANGFTPIWQDEERLQLLREELLGLANDGLVPEEYGYALHAPNDSGVCHELRLSSEYLLALEHLSRGRLDQDVHEPMWTAPGMLVPVHYSVAGLAALGIGDMTAAFDQARPSLPAYRELRLAYSHMDKHPTEFLPIPDGPSIKPGMNDPRLPQLAQQLMLGGYLPEISSIGMSLDVVTEPAASVRAQPLVYDEQLEQAVRLFQAEHGLQADGIAGKQTLKAINTSPHMRLQQVRINLERLRWLEARRHGYMLLVNSAGGHIQLYRGNEIEWQSRAQAGSAGRATPLLESRISRITLNPSWTIPPTILRQDKLPAIRQDPDYFAKRDLQVLDFDGNRLNPAQIDWNNPPGFMLRQPPGPTNPLGRLVFRFNNPFAVYLHDTPSQALFARAERNVSSGCVRVEEAPNLASHLFDALDDRQRARIERLQATGETHEIRITDGPQVILGYWTAEATQDGRLLLMPDPYDLDSALIDAFARETRVKEVTETD